MGKKFAPGEVFGFGWKAMKSNFIFFMVLLVSSALVNFANNTISKAVVNSLLGTLIVYIIFSIIQVALGMIFTKVSLQLSNNEQAGSGDFFSFFQSFMDYLFASALYWLIIIGGLILLIVPGIIWAIQFGQFGFIIIDKGANPIEALKKSSAITRGFKKDLLKFYILSFLINILGLICLIVGLLAAIPTTLVASACVYRKLSEQATV